MHMRPRPAAGLQPTAAVLPVRSVAAQMPIGGLLIGMTDAQGHGFVIATTYNLIWRDSGSRTAVAPFGSAKADISSRLRKRVKRDGILFWSTLSSLMAAVSVDDTCA
jgi:hypothetical protein